MNSTRLITFFAMLFCATLSAQDWCSSSPTPPPGQKITGLRFQGYGGHGDTTDPPCDKAKCVTLPVSVPADAEIVDAHLCAAVRAGTFHECKATGNPVWYDCQDNPPYIRFSNLYTTAPQNNKKTVRVTCKIWTKDLRDVRFFVVYKSASAAAFPLKTLIYTHLSKREKAEMAAK